MNAHLKMSLLYLSHGADNSTAMLVHHAFRSEQERLITQLVNEHADHDYDKAAITNDELERITLEISRITLSLANECESLSMEILKLQDPKHYELRKASQRDKSVELVGLYDERFFGKPYNPGAEEGGSNE